MDDQEFLKLQFITLRDEIRETKDRIFKTMGIGLLGLPASYFLAKAYKIDTVIILLPFIVVVVALLYLAENNALMRCGRYIKHNIEPQRIIGWETWLETKGADTWDARDVDKHLYIAFYLFFVLYFVGAAFIACRFVLSKCGTTAWVISIITYSAIGMLSAAYFLKYNRVSTTTEDEYK